MRRAKNLKKKIGMSRGGLGISIRWDAFPFIKWRTLNMFLKLKILTNLQNRCESAEIAHT